MKYEKRKIESLIFYSRNARTHSEAQVEQIKNSIKEFGFTNPVLIDGKNEIIAGHGRVMAARSLGLDEVPCIVIDHLTDTQRRAYIICDNKIALNSGWNEDLLADEMARLQAEDFDLSLIGFDHAELIAMAEGLDDNQGGAGKADDQGAEIPEGEPVTKRGDLYALGKHRLLCGDSSNKDDVARVMTEQKIDLLFTDPPYGIKRDKGFGGAGGFNSDGKPIPRRVYTDDWDSSRPEKTTFDFLLTLAKQSMIFGGNFFADSLPAGNHWLVWDKLNTMPTFGDCELVWTNVNRNSVKKYTVQYNGLIGKEPERFHPTQKPVKIIEDILFDYSNDGDIVFDPFCGSGTTLIACEQTGRVCFGIEIEPKYCDIILSRWQTLTGDQAVKL